MGQGYHSSVGTCWVCHFCSFDFPHKATDFDSAGLAGQEALAMRLIENGVRLVDFEMLEHLRVCFGGRKAKTVERLG